MNQLLKFHTIAGKRGYFKNEVAFRAYMESFGYNSVHISRNLNKCLKQGLMTAKKDSWIKTNKIKKDRSWKGLKAVNHHIEIDEQRLQNILKRKLVQMRYRANKLSINSKSQELKGQISVKRISEISGYSIGYVQELKHRLQASGALIIKHGKRHVKKAIMRLTRTGVEVQREYKRPCDIIEYGACIMPRRTKWSSESLSFFNH